MAAPAAPVALFVFNRPDLTARVFEVVRAAKPPVLLVASDGPRDDHADDADKCAQVRDIVTDVDWPCDVHYKFEDRNLGCDPAISSAIDWVFSIVDRAVLLEDDCIPDESFFDFCNELLERYADDTRVMQIAGSNLEMPTESFNGSSYAFASFGLVWGWATWRRAWNLYDADLSTWPKFRDDGMLDGLHASWKRRMAMRREYDGVHGDPGRPWDRPWQYTVLTEHGLVAYPERNLVTNDGFRSDATHTSGAGAMAATPRGRLDLPLRHPASVSENPKVEAFLEREILRAEGAAVTLLRKVVRSHRVRRALRRILLPTARHGPSPESLDGSVRTSRGADRS